MSLFEELKRRNVFRVGIAYGLVAWVGLQGADFVLDLIGAPDWVIRALAVAMGLGLPVALVMAWAFELTPEGIKREHEVDRSASLTPVTGRRLDRFIILALGLVVAWFLFDEFYLEPRDQAPATAVLQPETAEAPMVADPPADQAPRTTLAVLPFRPMSRGPDDEFFADGLTEEILNALAQVPDLSVTSRTSAFHFKDQDIPVRDIAAQLGVAHVVEGSVRRSGDRLRVTAQLIRVGDDTHLWSRTYDSTEADALTVQEDIAQRIAEALNVYLDDDTKQRMANSGFRDVDAFIAYQKGVNLHFRAHGDAHMLDLLAEGNESIGQALAISPTSTVAWLYYSDYYTHLLVDDAVGRLETPLDPAQVEAAYQAAENAFVEAARHAPNPGVRTMAELDLAIYRGDAARWPELMGRALEAAGCPEPVWVQLIGFLPRFNADYRERVQALRECNPFLVSLNTHLAVSELWSKDPEGALRSLSTLRGDMANTQFAVDARYKALLMQGNDDRARSVINIDLTNAAKREAGHILLLASAGQAAEAGRRLDVALEDPGLDDYDGLLSAAWIGDRERANTIAGRIDSAKLGHLALMAVTYWCLCGAPFDLEAAPNFAALWAESGFDWPPPSPLPLPAKDW